MNDKHAEYKNTVSIKQLSDAVENSDDDSLFWARLLDDVKLSFKNSIRCVQETRNKVISLMKMNLVLASFYVALFQFGASDLYLNSDWILLLATFVPLLTAMMLFLIAYFILEKNRIGISSWNAHRFISKGYNKYEYHQTMVVIYLKWGDKNIRRNNRAVKYMTAGVGSMAASLAGIVFQLV